MEGDTVNRKPSSLTRRFSRAAAAFVTEVGRLLGDDPRTAPYGLPPRRLHLVDQADDEAAARRRHPAGKDRLTDEPIPYTLTPEAWDEAAAVAAWRVPYRHPSWIDAPARPTSLALIRGAWTDDEAEAAAADALGSGYTPREVALALAAYIAERDRPVPYTLAGAE